MLLLAFLMGSSHAADAEPQVVDPGGRVVLEAVSGVGVGTAGAVGGALLAGSVLIANDHPVDVDLQDPWTVSNGALAGGWLVGAAIGSTYGVWSVHRHLDPEPAPSFARVLGGALMGSAIGGVIGGTGLVVAADQPALARGALLVGGVAGPVLGAVVAAELPAPDTRARRAPAVSMWALPRSDGGTLGASGRF